jgi:hypothetical protein
MRTGRLSAKKLKNFTAYGGASGCAVAQTQVPKQRIVMQMLR